MHRVEAAIQSGKCVLAFGGRTLQDTEILIELRRRNIPAVVLGGSPVEPARALDAAVLAPALGGGLLVLVEPDGATDGRALEALDGLLRQTATKPRVHVVAKAFNPFMLPMGMRLMKLDQHKMRAKDFLSALPLGAPAAAPEAEKAAEKPKSGGAPRTMLIGRETELESLKPMLAGGGPLVLVGPAGSGRTWLLEKALEGAGLTRLPDLTLSRGCGFDSLLARFAEATGDSDLQAALKSREAVAPAELISLALRSLQALSGKVMVVRGLKTQLRPDGRFQRTDRLGLLLKALLTTTTPLRLVFIAEKAPAFGREGEGRAMSVFEVGGLRGRELYGIFENYHCGDVARDKMGEVFNQVAGHPLATRLYAVAWRDANDREALFENKKFLKMGEIGNLEPLVRHIQRRLEKVDGDTNDGLTVVAQSPVELTGKDLAELAITRELRIRLLASGLMDASVVGDEKRYSIHPLIASQLQGGRLGDFEVLERIAQVILRRAGESSGVEKLALQQAANLLFTRARAWRSRLELPYRDQDALVDAVRGMLRGREPRLDMAFQRVAEGLKRDPGNSELRLLKADILSSRPEAEAELSAWLEETEKLCPTPEVFHAIASWLDARRRKGDQARAVEILQRGSALFPGEASLLRRAGAILMEMRRLDEAERLLRAANDVEPMDAGTYARLGDLALAQGRLGDAEEALRYAVNLDPSDLDTRARLAGLLRRRAAADAEQREALVKEASEMLEESLRGQPDVAALYAELAMLLLENGGDAERAEWAARKAAKLGGGKSPEALLLHARLLLRRGNAAEAEALIERVRKTRGMEHHASAVMSELLFAKGKIFLADAELERALKLCPEDAPERVAYLKERERLQMLITSGQAVEIERAAEAAALANPEPAPTETRVNSDRGNNTVRRSKGGRGRGRGNGRDNGAGAEAPADAGAEAAADAAPEAAGEAVEAPAAAEEAPAAE